jgi:predicted 2-oxoglutarate/Fe(II)-dependent dioxygenase YbiX
MLLELGQTILTLRAQNAADENVLALTGLYHNLRRLWSEP